METVDRKNSNLDNTGVPDFFDENNKLPKIRHIFIELCKNTCASAICQQQLLTCNNHIQIIVFIINKE
nr:hypothetical protein [uncultured Desulfobulbus sp.]